ncbi:NAD-dependent dehydratase [Candidatus Roizmanbacteria bacterium CG_4_10_14_0_8_um_filter_39_9]|uniref:UDP-glucuronate decarboxylase n=1 Tax=Candidatus Roizmanbacteria bacterium CG_4_10_14_0_8_um_filter_39_9 TaxID=1974829 RepID=A0A2M7QD26_9BACT|nr:MAG: NAD-dependent dehydratase [Candidatus Roizmanbacteria bacterium CG_4_10_14_0_8_um_filter_39_9]
MRILITGVAGFIGSNLAQSLLDAGNSVVGVDNLLTGSSINIEILKANNNFTYIQDDVVTMDMERITGTFDIIFHLASPASPVQYKKFPLETLMVNSIGTKHVLDFMKKSGSKIFVISSTSEVYGDPLEHPQTESYWGNVNPVGVRSCYDEGKRFAESLVMTYYRTHKLDVRIARIFNTYGPNMEQNDGRVVSNFIMQSLQGQPVTIYSNGKQTRSFCYVSDMVQGLTSLGVTPNIAGEIINIGNPNEMNMIDLANKIIALTGSSSKIVFNAIDGDDPQKRKPDISKAKKLLGWKPQVTLDDGLQKTITYFKERFL